MTADDLIKAAPAIVAAVVALVKILPALAIAFRRRHIGGKTGSLPEIVGYQAPLPWSDYLNERLTGSSPQTGLRRKSILVVLIIMAGLSLIEVLYVIIAVHTALAAWSIILSLTVWVIVIAGLGSVLSRLARNADQLTGAVPQRGSMTVRGRSDDDVARHALAIVAAMGARLIAFDGRVIHAATGVQLAARVFVGEHLKVGLQRIDDDTVQIVAESIKLDYVTPSRSRRNVLIFLEAWLPFESEPQASPPRAEGDSDDDRS